MLNPWWNVTVWTMARHLQRRGAPVDPRTDIDTASLKERFPSLAAVEVTDLTITGPHGPVPARMYRAAGTSPRAGFVWMHGGAFVAGDLDMPESNWVGLELAAAGVPTLTVDYRKALNGVHFPVPRDDVRAAWHHAVAHAQELFGVDARRLHLGGASAGATWAAAVALALRDELRDDPRDELSDEGAPLPASLVLAYPMMHPVLPRNDADTRAAMAKMPARLRFRPGLARALAVHVAGKDGLTDPHVFAGLASDLSGMPPTFVLVAAIDDLRASGETFAAQLHADGVQVLLVAERSATHGHLNHPDAASARRSITRIAAWLRGED